jgi:hypothetical protein
MIAMIEAAFGTALMAIAGGSDRGHPPREATRRRAIRVAPIARRADREEAVAPPTRSLAEGRVHDVGAGARFDWTPGANRGTRDPTGSVRRSIEAVIEGQEIHLRALTSIRHRLTAYPSLLARRRGAQRRPRPTITAVFTAAERLLVLSLTSPSLMTAQGSSLVEISALSRDRRQTPAIRRPGE